MIRMVLFAIGFIAITVTLIIVQPGANRRAPDALPQAAVTRADPGLSRDVPERTAPSAQAESGDVYSGGGLIGDFGTQGLTQPEETARVTPSAPRVSRPVPSSGADLDDQEMRRMTWDTLSSLNHATGRERAPGQPGSLLHTIVRRSLDGAPTSGTASAVAVPDVYVVQDGDSLVSIAEKIYGDVNMTGPLFAANQTLLNRPDDLRVGQTLVLPAK